MLHFKKISIALVALGAFAMSAAVVPANVSFAATTKTQPLKVVGMAKFVLQGTVSSVAGGSVTFHVTNTSKNAKSFDAKDKTLSVGSKTVITKNGKNIYLNQIKSGDKIKVFGIFDKKSGAITLVRWVKVVQK